VPRTIQPRRLAGRPDPQKSHVELLARAGFLAVAVPFFFARPPLPLPAETEVDTGRRPGEPSHCVSQICTGAIVALAAKRAYYCNGFLSMYINSEGAFLFATAVPELVFDPGC